MLRPSDSDLHADEAHAARGDATTSDRQRVVGARAIRRWLVATVALGACHSSLHYQDTRNGERRTVRQPGAARALPPAATVDDRGQLRFAQALMCATVTETDVASFDVDQVRPNAATVVLGVVMTGLGVVAASSGLSTDDPAASALTYLGAGGIVVGLPLMIGPFVGTRVERNPLGTQVVRQPGGEERCGERPVAARRATVLWNGLHVEGTVDGDGVFALSPFDFVDALEPRLPALDLSIDLETADGKLGLDKIVDASALAAARPGFFAARHIDAVVPPLSQLEKLPQFEPGRLAVVLAPGPSLRLSLPIDNVGPGAGFALRAVLASSSPELDGRVIYLGRLEAGGHGEFTATIPLSAEAERVVASAGFTIAALIRDGLGLAPSTPVRFRGVVLRTGS